MATHQQVQDYCIPGRLKEVNIHRVYLKILKEKLINGVITRFRFLVSPYLETFRLPVYIPIQMFPGLSRNDMSLTFYS
jgi:hypothetical protein